MTISNTTVCPKYSEYTLIFSFCPYILHLKSRKTFSKIYSKQNKRKTPTQIFFETPSTEGTDGEDKFRMKPATSSMQAYGASGDFSLGKYISVKQCHPVASQAKLAYNLRTQAPVPASAHDRRQKRGFFLTDR